MALHHSGFRAVVNILRPRNFLQHYVHFYLNTPKYSKLIIWWNFLIVCKKENHEQSHWSINRVWILLTLIILPFKRNFPARLKSAALELKCWFKKIEKSNYLSVKYCHSVSFNFQIMDIFHIIFSNVFLQV